MKTFFYNLGYYLMEAVRSVRFGLLSNLFSVIGTGLILFLLGMVLTGWSIGDELVQALEQEAEISAYFPEGTGSTQVQKLADEIQSIPGVLSVSYVDETQAHERMEKMLGEEAGILGLFEENPFEAFLEIHINLDQMDQVLYNIKKLDQVEYVRDNRSILEQLKNITRGLRLAGLLVITAVSVTTLIIISHMIRQGIYNNREQIKTLRLLGAPNGFIGFPFFLAGTILTLCGGLLAILFTVLIINGGYHQFGTMIPFLPLPDQTDLRTKVSLILLGISLGLGILGSLFGLSSIKEEGQ